jgi:hypothetical protein
VLLASLIVGGLTAYWFGLRPGAWAAAVTFGLCLLAVLVPDLAIPIYVLLAAGVGAVCIVGPQREQPADAARAVRLVRAAIAQASTRLRSPLHRRDKHNGTGPDHQSGE